MSTGDQLDLQTLGSQPVIMPNHWFLVALLKSLHVSFKLPTYSLLNNEGWT